LAQRVQYYRLKAGNGNNAEPKTHEGSNIMEEKKDATAKVAVKELEVVPSVTPDYSNVTHFIGTFTLAKKMRDLAGCTHKRYEVTIERPAPAALAEAVQLEAWCQKRFKANLSTLLDKAFAQVSYGPNYSAEFFDTTSDKEGKILTAIFKNGHQAAQEDLDSVTLDAKPKASSAIKVKAMKANKAEADTGRTVEQLASVFKYLTEHPKSTVAAAEKILGFTPAAK